MRSKNGSYTPREAAIVITLGWLEAAYRGLTNDLYEIDPRDSYRVQVRRALAKEHNRLLRRTTMDGSELDEESNFLPNSVSSTDKYSEEN